jgi:hypothetical protein
VTVNWPAGNKQCKATATCNAGSGRDSKGPNTPRVCACTRTGLQGTDSKQQATRSAKQQAVVRQCSTRSQGDSKAPHAPLTLACRRQKLQRGAIRF